MHYRAAEKMLYTYPVNMMRYREALLEYMRICGETDCHGQSYRESMNDNREPGDPVNEYVARKQRAEKEFKKYSVLTREVGKIRRELRASDDVKEQIMLQVMELYYFEGMSMRELAMHLGQNERTLYRRREELVKRVMASWR